MRGPPGAWRRVEPIGGAAHEARDTTAHGRRLPLALCCCLCLELSASLLTECERVAWVGGDHHDLPFTVRTTLPVF